MSTAPNMATMAASLERSLQNCSLNGSSNGPNNGGFGRSASSDDSTHENLNSMASSDNSSTLELNSETALPYHWEQCLDLKTGEVYYVNWRNGSRTKEDPRKCSTVRFEREIHNQYYYSDDEDSSYDSEGSSSASSPSDLNYTSTTTNGADQVLVVAGCKSCMMYFMLPKRAEECPKCNAFLLHFDGSHHKSP